jgi:hypothetical protein
VTQPSTETQPGAEFSAVVVDVRLESTVHGKSMWQIALDHTMFKDGATGSFSASARSGARLTIPVLRVHTDPDGTVWHVVGKPLTEGTNIEARVLQPNASLLH